jgi:hypothetical protein
VYIGFSDNAYVPCNQLPGASDIAESYKTVSNVSTINRLVSVNDNGRTYVLLGDAQPTNQLDFVASTLAINTECVPISSACNLTSNQNASFSCSPLFSAELDIKYYASGYNPRLDAPIYYWNMRFFNDSTMSVETDMQYPVNPTYIGIVAIMSFALEDDAVDGYPDMRLNDTRAFVLLCSATVFDVTYSWVNGSLATLSNLSLSNVSSAGVINSALQTTPVLNVTTGYYQMTTGAAVASLTSDSEESIAEKIAVLYSQTSLGFAAGVFSARANEEEHVREQILVARIPVAPFYFLIVSNCLYGAVAFIAALVAFHCTRSEGVQEIQHCLSIWGLVEHGFGDPILDKFVTVPLAQS